jgi:hypothetical protein
MLLCPSTAKPAAAASLGNSRLLASTNRSSRAKDTSLVTSSLLLAPALLPFVLVEDEEEE